MILVDGASSWDGNTFWRWAVFFLSVRGFRAKARIGRPSFGQNRCWKPLKKLQKQRFNEALAEAQLSYKLFTQGVPGNYSPIDAGKRLQNAAVEVFSLKEAISFLTELHGYADAIEKNLEMRTKRNLAKASIQPVLQVELHKARQFRLEIEIQKLKLETGVK